MSLIFSLIINLISNPLITFSLIGFLSFFALFTALYAETFLSIEPSILCLYQRYPFAIGISLALIGLGMRKKTFIARILFVMSGVSFLVNSSIALYQSGIQLDWWTSGIEACSTTFFAEDASPQNILANIMSAPLASCDEIQWADPTWELTIANYNAVFCFGLFVFCLLAAWFVNKPTN